MEKWPNQNKENLNFDNKDLPTKAVKLLSNSEITESQRNTLKKIIISYIEEQNLEIVIPNTPEGKPFTEDGELLIENKYVKIQINDKENQIESEKIKPLIEIIKKEAENFITPFLDPFKAIIVVNNNSLSIRIDSGQHKEFIGILLSHEKGVPHALIYKHTPSNYERVNYEKSNRVDYIQKITNGSIDEQRKEVSNVLLIDSQKELQKKFQEFFRLCQSVKDLDLKLQKEDVSFAVNMFREGVVNMDGFLSFCDRYDSFEEYLNSAGKGKIISGPEEKILEKYFTENYEGKKWMRENLKLLHSAKDLNFEAISDLIKLSDKARDILSISEPSPKKADDFLDAYKKAVDKIIEMEGIAKRVTGPRSNLLQNVNVKELAGRLYKNVEQLALIARFGYGSPDVLKHEDNSVNISEEGRKRLPETAKRAYEQFALVLQDKGDKITDWSNVESLEEAVRFLHDAIIKIPIFFSGYGGHGAKELLDSKFYRKKNEENEDLRPLKIINIANNKLDESEIAKTVIKFLRGLGYCFERVFQEESGYYQSPTAIFSDDYFEMSLPTAEHYIEMSSQIYEGKQKEYTIALRYVESGQYGAMQRQDFATVVFEQYGFNVKRDRRKRGNLYANFKTEDKAMWDNALQNTIRLSVALKDLDLIEIKNDMIDLFKDGVITQFSQFRKIKQVLEQKTEINDDIKNNVRMIVEFGSDSEKKLLMNLLSANTKSFNKDFAPFLEQLNDDQLDGLATYLFDLEDEAKAKKDKKLARRLHRIGDKLVALIFAKEKSEQNQ